MPSQRHALTREAAPPQLGQGLRQAACTALALLALSGAFAPALAAQDCPPGLLPDGLDECQKPSQASELPLDDRQPMRFELLMIGSGVIYVQGTGTITAETPTVLKAFLATEDGQTTRNLFLHSPGGDLAAALELGEIIRQARLSTSISRAIPLEGVFDVHHYDRAECIGACALAFLGGVGRSYGKGDHYGLPHLGRGKAGVRGKGAVTPERLTAYLDRMGVARELLDAAPTARGDIAALSPERGKALRVNFEPSGRTVFKPGRFGSEPAVSFEIVTRAKDLNGRIFCLDGEPRLTIFDPSRRLFTGLEGMRNRPATFTDPDKRIVEATVSHVPATLSGMDPALVFRIPDLTAAAFLGAGLALEDIERGAMGPGAFAWADLMIDMAFTVAADNAEETLPDVLRGCSRKERARGKRAKASAR